MGLLSETQPCGHSGPAVGETATLAPNPAAWAKWQTKMAEWRLADSQLDSLPFQTTLAKRFHNNQSSSIFNSIDAGKRQQSWALKAIIWQSIEANG